MVQDRSYFFVGIGGSGMMPLALIVQRLGGQVAGSDRSRDQGRLGQTFAALEAQGVRLFAQDGSGVTDPSMTVVASAAVEASVPDIAAARSIGARVITRAQLLSCLFNAAPVSIGVAGTSGKSTTTAMIAWILHKAGRDPTVVNGAAMRNFQSGAAALAACVAGGPDMFVAEVDESDGSIAGYDASVAVINNIALDHKSMAELRELFGGFAARARHVVLNLDNPETALLARSGVPGGVSTFSLTDPEADFHCADLVLLADGVRFQVVDRVRGERAGLRLAMPGRHNASNALAAIASAAACGVPVLQAAQALAGFKGVARRMDIVGTAAGVTVIDDFAHNPDKILATLSTLRAQSGRILVFFQPHGYGPLRLMRRELVAAFAGGLASGDMLFIPDPAYFGGTTDRSVGSVELVSDLSDQGVSAFHVASRDSALERLASVARDGDRIVIMGARDDTLSTYAAAVLQVLARPG